MLRRIASICCTLIALLATGIASAYPDRPITLVVGWPPGGATDANARVLAKALGERLRQPVVVENRPGAGGSIGGGVVAKAKPDGYTLAYIASSNVITSLLIKAPNYGAGRDLEPISLVAEEPLILLVSNQVPATSLNAFIDYARKHSGYLNYATTGKGGILHLAGAALVHHTGLDAVDVPYKGTSPALAALMAGDVQFFFGTFSDALPVVKSGRVRALAVAAAMRSPLLPDVPTLSEALGRPNDERGTWQAVLAPKGTPDAIVQMLAGTIAAIMQQPEIRDPLSGRGVAAATSSPSELGERIDSELARRGPIIQALGIQAN